LLSLSLNDVFLLFKGLGITLGLFIGVIPFGIVFGSLLAMLRVVNPFGLGLLASLWIELFRSVPLVLFLFFTHYGLFPALVQHFPVLGPQPDIIVSCFLTFCVFEGAYFAEILRGGILSVRETEKDVAISLGLNAIQQWTLIYLPLAFQRSVPSLVNQSVTLLKDTSLASIVGVVEFSRAGEMVYERTYQYFEILALQAVIYFGLCLGLSRLAKRWEQTQPSP
jgi:His/Glu/Gln/Arg/opine family amino acid ABC transporter permease subunit